MIWRTLNFLNTLKLLLQKGKIYLVFLSISIFIFSSFVVIVLGVRNAINKTVEESIGSKLPPDTIKVTPKIIPKTIFAGNVKGAQILQKDYIRISRIKGVKKVYRIMEVPFPSSVILRIFGIVGRSDMVTYGVDAELVKRDIFKGLSFKYTEGEKRIPFVVPKGVIEGYNLAFARGQGTPTVSENMLKGLTFTFYAGRSSFKTLQKYIENEGIIVGISDNIPPLSICMPISAATYLTKQIVPNHIPSYSMLYVEVKSHEFVNDVISQIRRMGFVVETSTDKTVFVESIKSFISYIILGLIILVGIFAVVSVFISIMLFVATKVDFLSLLRLLGANKLYISIAILTLITTIVFVFSVVSSLISQSVFINYASMLIDQYDILKSFIRKEFFYITTNDIMIPVLISVVLSVISSVFISFRFLVKSV
ncbi:MAG: hypothetical protein RMJ37_03370 [Spirochaetia bacterium]|nr:hypothetical protein [Spirochaetota bacterium]MCX8096503.1 hypothetical protein [Spirochaetota bacterium]MDW8112367.1 hypothetical protein [Spirochaetia bacterium]